VIGLAKSSLDLVKSVQSLVKDSGKAELREKTTDLTQKIADLTQQVTELVLLNSDLHGKLLESKQEMATLQDRLKLRDELVPSGNVYKRKLPDGKEDGPFCTRCADVDGTLVRVITGQRSNGEKTFHCPHCSVLKAGATQ
jgi:hypothetical protein